ncbi:craniofacial development protein 2-like [Amphiura filiformis]|uniref:craniofacial development protein 2-like n=1 Tax=Amphiura filiformis TaxID=82378 RepID=UPI003B219D6F
MAYNIDILGIQKHRIVHKEPVRYENILGQTLITTSAVRNRAGAATGGVGIVLSSSTKSSLASVTQYTDRILANNFQGNPATTVIVTHCPTNMNNEENIEAHYDNLRRAIDSIPAHNVLVIVGDFNGRVGTGDANYTYHNTTNRNGKYMVDLVIDKNLIIANTYFRKRNGKLWTYMSPTGSKYQLDYVLIRKKWKNSLLNAEAYSTFSSIGTDHRSVSARIRLSLRKSKALSRKKHYDWRVLCSNIKLQQQCTIEVRNRFQPLEDINENATERYERFISATTEEKIIHVRKKIRKACFSSDHRVTTARQKIKKVYETYQESTTEDNRLSCDQARSELAGAYNQAIEDDLNIKLREV